MSQMKYDFFQKKKNNKNKKMLTIFSILFMVPTLLCVLLFATLMLVKGELDDLKQVMYGSHSEETLAADNTAFSMENGTVTNALFNSSDNTDVLYAENENVDNVIKVCLTFDDGPSANTNKILDILDSYGVKATFFVNGRSGYDEEYWRIVSEGHTIGMHSYTHSYAQIYESLDTFAEDLFDIQSFIYERTGVTSIYYRFPGGSSNDVCNVNMLDCIDYLNAKGIIYYDWNVSAQDAVGGGASTTEIVNNVMGPIYSGDCDTYIILLHDSQDKSTTVEALPIIIEKLADMENVVIVPIDESITPIQHIARDTQ